MTPKSSLLFLFCPLCRPKTPRVYVYDSVCCRIVYLINIPQEFFVIYGDSFYFVLYPAPVLTLPQSTLTILTLKIYSLSCIRSDTSPTNSFLNFPSPVCVFVLHVSLSYLTMYLRPLCHHSNLVESKKGVRISLNTRFQFY